MIMNDLYSAYGAKVAELKAMDEKVEKREAALDRLKKKRDKLWDNLSWVSMMVEPLAKALVEYTGGESFKIYGPFGLRAYTSVYIRRGNQLGGITLTTCPAEDGAWRLRYDTGEKRGGYAEGSIGALNGFDNVTAALPDGIEEIASLLRWFDDPENRE